MMKATSTLLVLMTLMTKFCSSNELRWDHSIDLDDNFRLLWRVKQPDIIFEVQVKTLGYVGIGFARSEYVYGADMYVGWVDTDHTFFQDRHIPIHSNNGEPVMDPSQDFVLLGGRENSTHTIIRFRRKLKTCDEKYDVSITNDTMKIVYMYHDDEPKRGSFELGSLPEPEVALKPIRSLVLLQRPKFERIDRKIKQDETVGAFDVRMKNVSLTNITSACSFVRPKLNKRGHITAFKPIFEPLMARNYIIHMTVYECKPPHTYNTDDDDNMYLCTKLDELQCGSIVATWSKGSEGFVYPDDVGYPVDVEAAYLLMVRYEPFKSLIDGSGIKFYTTATRRKHDAGILSIGIQPVWTHVIPPGFRKVTSIGYCTGKCNKEAFAPDGINVVAIQMQTHEMGKSVKVGLVRNGAELNPIAHDQNIDSEYLEYRQLEEPVQIFPGDDLMVECAYNSYEKTKLTLGGYEPQQEICQAMLIYYPRQKKLTSCQSKARTKYFLNSLNIEKLQNTPPFAIELPEKYAGKTLEEHLRAYNWRVEFDKFERVSKTSPVDIICIDFDRRQKVINDDPVHIKHPTQPPVSVCERKQSHIVEQAEDSNISNVQQARSKVLRSSDLSTLDFSSSSCRLRKLNWMFLVASFIVISLKTSIVTFY